MKHLIEISQLSRAEVEMLMERAAFFKTNQIYPCYSSYAVANLFYENSTRTRVSFELAAKHLGMPVVNVDLQHSSETKGESIQDTLSTLAAMGIRMLVIRHVQEGLPQTLADQLKDVHIINAGDGQHAHPSQALLDMMTILEKKSSLKSLKIVVIGDIRHSRVARSFAAICALLGVENVVWVAPPTWQPTEFPHGQITSSLRQGLTDADVVMCLRVQRERLSVDEAIDLTLYRRDYALTSAGLAYAKSDVMVMHPGPMNRGVEIDSDVADGLQSCVLQQVNNGVFMRMAIFESLVRG